MTKTTKQAERHVESFLAALEIMDCFIVHPAMTIKQMINATGFTRNLSLGTPCYHGNQPDDPWVFGHAAYSDDTRSQEKKK